MNATCAHAVWCSQVAWAAPPAPTQPTPHHPTVRDQAGGQPQRTPTAGPRVRNERCGDAAEERRAANGWDRVGLEVTRACRWPRLPSLQTQGRVNLREVRHVVVPRRFSAGPVLPRGVPHGAGHRFARVRRVQPAGLGAVSHGRLQLVAGCAGPGCSGSPGRSRPLWSARRCAARVSGAAPRTNDMDTDERRQTIPQRGRPTTNGPQGVDKRFLIRGSAGSPVRNRRTNAEPPQGTADVGPPVNAMALKTRDCCCLLAVRYERRSSVAELFRDLPEPWGHYRRTERRFPI